LKESGVQVLGNMLVSSKGIFRNWIFLTILKDIELLIN
jgi:hypothetical protein